MCIMLGRRGTITNSDDAGNYTVRLDAARHLYNACLAEALERLRRVRESLPMTKQVL
jgi:hypothetical protein